MRRDYIRTFPSYTHHSKPTISPYGNRLHEICIIDHVVRFLQENVVSICVVRFFGARLRLESSLHQCKDWFCSCPSFLISRDFGSSRLSEGKLEYKINKRVHSVTKRGQLQNEKSRIVCICAW